MLIASTSCAVQFSSGSHKRDRGDAVDASDISSLDRASAPILRLELSPIIAGVMTFMIGEPVTCED